MLLQISSTKLTIWLSLLLYTALLLLFRLPYGPRSSKSIASSFSSASYLLRSFPQCPGISSPSGSSIPLISLIGSFFFFYRSGIITGLATVSCSFSCMPCKTFSLSISFLIDSVLNLNSARSFFSLSFRSLSIRFFSKAALY